MNIETEKAMVVGLIMFDRKPVIMKQWTPDLNLKEEDIQQVPKWIKTPHLSLKYWGQQTLYKLERKINTPIKNDKATVHKDKLEYACILIEVRMD